MQKKEILVEKERKLVALLGDYGFSFAQINKMLKNKDVKVDGKPEKNNILVQEGQRVTAFYPEDAFEQKYEKVYEDNSVLLIYKYSGIETAGEAGLAKILEVTPVHRLDRNTEGLVVFAKTPEAEEILTQAFKQKQISKFYIAEVVGKSDLNGLYNAFLTKDSQRAEVKIYDRQVPNSIPISTRIKTIKTGNESSLVLVELLSGKTHQIRAHLAHLGHPIIGDQKYGDGKINKKFHKNRQKLACFCLIFKEIALDGVKNKKFVKFPKWLDGMEKLLEEF